VRANIKNVNDLHRRTGCSAAVRPATARAWVEAWKAAGIELERLRRKKLRGLTPRQIQQAMVSFDGAFKSLQRKKARKRASGLVEMQAWFRRLRK
jgi:beta-phosphoglucomutase-like phosphatase (HAD superfamily)